MSASDQQNSSEINANEKGSNEALNEVPNETPKRKASRSASRRQSTISVTGKDVKTISDIVGTWGPYQSKIFGLYLAIYIIAPFNNQAIVFYTDKVDYWCKLPDGINKTSVNATTCTQYGSEAKCTEWEYDYTVYQGNMIQEFDLVCDRAIYISYGKSIYQFGYLVSSLFFGWFSDKHGRRLALRASILLELCMSFIQAWSPNIGIFLISRFLLGIGAYSRFLTGMLILLEWAAPKNRARVQILSELGYTMGTFLVPGVYILIRNYRYTQMLIFTWELIMLYPTWKFYPDSPTWLILKGRYAEVEENLTKAANMNGIGDREYVTKKLETLKKNIIREEKEREAESKKTILDLFKVPRLLMFAIVIYFMWFSIAFIRYGFSYNIGDLGGSIYLNWCMFESMTLIKKLITIGIINMFDRRTLMSSYLLLTAISFYVMIPFTFDDAYFTITLVLAVIGRFCSGSYFDLLYLITAEIFPTGMRQIGVGSGSVAARFGSILAPFTRELTNATNYATTVSVYATLAILASGFAWILPKTKDKPIPNTLEEAKRRKKKKEEEEENDDSIVMAAAGRSAN